MKHLNIAQSIIDSAVELLSFAQNADGGFTGLSSVTVDFQSSQQYQTTFFTALILGCLDSEKSSAQNNIADQAINFLLKQKSDNWTFNYWSRTSFECQSMPYPDDLDDTFCALGALYQHKLELFTGDVLAKVTKILISAEQQTGGPYRTWLVDQSVGKKWQDVDIAVNNNIARFLAQQKVLLPNLSAFVEQKINNNDLRSPYYPETLPIVYFISRWYQGQFKQKLVDGLMTQSLKIQNINLQDIALMVLALCNFGAGDKVSEPLINRLIKQYELHGWRAYSFCYDPAQHGQQYYAGSPYLTAALCLNALQSYCILKQPRLATKTNIHNLADQEMHCAVITAVEQRLAEAGLNVATVGIPFLRRMLAKDSDKQISLLPMKFAEAINASNKIITPRLVQKLCEANIYGWTAYTIYDHVMDEHCNIELLPVAQVCARQLVMIFELLLVGDTVHSQQIEQMFSQTMNDIDEANAWEIEHARWSPVNGQLLNHSLPDYDDLGHLARRSMGHALGPLTIMLSMGYSVDSKEYTSVQNFFYHYLIARQLNDDAHDWAEDLSRGQLTSVVVWLLQIYEAEGKGPKGPVDVSQEIDSVELQKLFWHSVIHTVNQHLKQHIAMARSEALRSGMFRNTSFIDRLLQPFEQALQKSRQETSQAKAFINEYKAGSNLL